MMILKKMIKNALRRINQLDKRRPRVASIKETVDYIINNKASVSRFGDGEFKWIYSFKQNSFQTQSKALSNDLKMVLRSNLENHIICIPEGTFRVDIYTEEAKEWWENFSGKYRILWNNLFDMKKQYYNLYISRPYLDLADKEGGKERFAYIKKIWANRDILIVEGEKTRLGVNNDLFDNANSVRRILCPPKNAYDKKDEIYDKVLKLAEDNDLILLALGPTATVLSYELALEGYQAIDIGHIDIEYEWFLKSADSKIPIKGKYVNEASTLGGDTPDDSIVDDLYLSQIISCVK